MKHSCPQFDRCAMTQIYWLSFKSKLYPHILQCIKTKKSKSRNRINFNFHLIKYRFIAKVKKKNTGQTDSKFFIMNKEVPVIRNNLRWSIPKNPDIVFFFYILIHDKTIYLIAQVHVVQGISILMWI